MGEPAKAFWINEPEEVEEAVESSFEDIACICTGLPDDCWKFGSD
ncbi:hypothetical protein DESUT3_13020 [Desulfuromonas versatilis]|uniref:Uncharacterized protein n=1 Tax=Desulfuromonas versatilis TaxID=2802975 RepID=A0ABN6DVQ8_9BACT|nr:hypothetical protein [Desulfuromonas versatilis]BCR04233.1 hypothetical protein DESUT3_13020 [Desulfuromonas versatilis]